ncbi:MAG: outer membrane protein transport protein [Chitinophagaceae bacterium]|nr:outer membrane protein transport protein [Chitinophagaceae bacterium]
MKRIVFAYSLIALLSPISLWAGGFKIALQGINQSGMGHTGVGFATDAATLYFNPAGLSFVGNQINGGVNLLFPSTSFYETHTNTITHAESQVFTPFSLYGNYALTDKINVGLGAYTPFGSGIMYPTDWSGRYILHRIDLQTIFLQPTVAYRLNKSVSIGAGFIYSFGHVNLEKDLPITSGANQDIAKASLNGKANGIGFNAGVYVKANERFNIGVTYHSKVVMKVKQGEATFSNIPSGLSSSFPASNSFKTELPLPSEIDAGISYQINKRLTAAIDFNYTFWKSFDSLGFDYEINTAAITDDKSPRLYQNAVAVRFGLQMKATEKATLRAGMFYDQTPVQEGYVAPELPDNNKLGFTLGASYAFTPKLKLDLALLYENVPSRTQTNLETNLQGTFQTKVIAPALGLTYSFQPKKNESQN